MAENKQDLSFVIAGLGSMGRRHLTNLMHLGVDNITLFRSGKSTLPNSEFLHVPVEYDLTKLLSNCPDAVIISNPTALHMEVALQAANAGSHILLEKPISHNLAGVRELELMVREKGLKVLVGFQFRFHPALKQIKSWVDEGILGKVLHVEVHWGEFLPSWHPWEDYKKGYSARRDLGGGVLLTLCHPFDYLKWLFGDMHSVFAMTDHVSDLEIDTEDMALVSLRFVSGLLGTVHLDYVRRPPKHHLTILCEEGVISWDNDESCALMQDGETHKIKRICPPESFERNALFTDEISHFIDCIRNGQNPICGLGEGIHALKVVLAAKKSATEKHEVEIASIV